MTGPQIALVTIVVLTLVLFAWGRWRYDLVALVALIACVLTGLVAPEDAFRGFGHPATITVAFVLILSRGLMASGAVDGIARGLGPLAGRPTAYTGALSGIAAALSAFMNNVGALALLMPIASETAAKAKRSPRAVLMPLAFASLLGGLVTLIGTPPNIIVAAYRGQVADVPFGMFDFMPVGLAVAGAGVAFIAVVGWRLIPRPDDAANAVQDLFEIEPYLAEGRVPKESKAEGKTLGEIDEMTRHLDAVVVGLIRGGRQSPSLPRYEPLRADDVLVVEADAEELDKFATALGLDIAGAEPGANAGKKNVAVAADAAIVELLVGPRSLLDGRTVEQMRFGPRFGAALLGVSRQGRSRRGRLRDFRFRVGDVLLLQGAPDQLPDVTQRLGCLPLAERGVAFGKRKTAWFSLAVFGAAIAAASTGLIAIPIALGIAAVVMVLTNIVPLREVYDEIEWPVIVLLGALIPVGDALRTTGTTELISNGFVALSGGASAAVPLTLLIVVTALLTNVLNNAATAVVMAPVGIGIAERAGMSADPFLMAVAVGASAAFLTPIGHQNNALVMGPGGYSFADYWPMGLPLTAITIAVAVPAILWFWPP